jgi:ABC-type Mn2+/Zn2+ transport system ATPase subunit
LTTSGAQFDIEIVPNGPGYKSISSASWTDIPNFAIITGRNGSGKTQLLEVLAYHLTGTHPPRGALGVQVKLSGVRIDADEVGYVPSSGRFAGSSNASLAQMQSMRQSLFQRVQQQHELLPVWWTPR